MKHFYFYFLLLFGLFYQSNLHAQFCPPTGFTNGTALFFFYDSGTSDCVDRPNQVSVGASVFSLGDCGDIFSVYNLSSGDPLTTFSPFTVDFGFGTCEYTDGNLTNQTLSTAQMDVVLKTLRLYPNPVNSGNTLNVSLGSSITGTIKIYSITGKLVYNKNIDNFKTSSIDVSSFNNGVYLLKIETDITSISKKVIINK